MKFTKEDKNSFNEDKNNFNEEKQSFGNYVVNFRQATTTEVENNKSI